MTAVEPFAGDLLADVAAWTIVLGIFAMLLAVLPPLLVVSLGVDGAYSLLA